MSKLINENLVDNGDGTYTQTRNSQFSAYYDIFIPAGTPIRAKINVIDHTLTSAGNNYLAQFIMEDGTKEYITLYTSNSTAIIQSINTFSKNVTSSLFYTF